MRHHDFESGGRPDFRGFRRHVREHIQDHFGEHAGPRAGFGPGSGPGFGPPGGFREHVAEHFADHVDARHGGPHDHGPHEHGPHEHGPHDHEGHDGPAGHGGPGGHGRRGRGFGPRGQGEPPFPPFPGFPPGGGRGFPGGFGFGFGPPEGLQDRLRGGRRGHGHGPHEHGERRGHGRGGRARRGNVRAAILALLAENPMHGYEMIKEIGERSGGFWRPSPGSVYPTLQLLADEGLVSADEGTSGKRLYSLTDEGKAAAEKLDDTPPWEQATNDVDPNEAGLRSAMGQLAAAAWQVSHAATSGQKARAVKAINEARSALYLILAEAGVEDDDPEADDTED
jgi:DNA-binding PadR family transcriptional regulator